MMTTFAATFIAFGVAVLALAAGLLLDGRRLRGSCGDAQDCHCTALAARRCPRRSA